MSNIYKNLPRELDAEHFESLLETQGFLLERIISRGQATPPGEWLSQERDEWVLLIKGQAGLLIDGEEEPRVLKRGDYVHIPAGKRHRVEWTLKGADTIWLALHFEADFLTVGLDPA
ncbi:MAG: cupin domain-containing protein [Candidatus Omnitrophica bacterium]|nr:cupin domain-containing protein [Candidatus Omnitrophota bacterium]MCB9720144.1 cupin domain-containing protein [Candidatus Omnitrophota bacterium]